MVENLEIEVKVLEANHKDLESRIILAGGIKTFEDDLIALRLDLNSKYSFNSPEMIRIRLEGNIVKITHKLKLEKSITTNCVETEIESPNNIYEVTNLFEKLGYKIIEETHKRRVSYNINLGNGEFVKFDFDKYHKELEFIPEFVEIESNTAKNVLRGIEILGVNENQITTYGLGDLKRIYEK